MSMKTRLQSLLEQGEFGEAAKLLKSHLNDAELLDPRDDRTWKEYADCIHRKLRQRNRSEAIDFWDDLRDFFEKNLEPKWKKQHLHKGHIFFRLGWLTLVDDVSKGKQYLQDALKEAKIWWEDKEKRGDSPLPAKEGVKQSSSYVTLCIIEGIEQAERSEDRLFESEIQRKNFFEELLSESFDAAIHGLGVSREKLNDALKNILPSKDETPTKDVIKLFKQAKALKEELAQVRYLELPVATVSLSGAFLEAIILAKWYREKGEWEVPTKKGRKKDIRKFPLHDLLKIVAREPDFFPSGSVEASCMLLRIFRNRIHAGNQLRREYELTPRVAITLKNLLDRSIVDWGKAIS